MSDSLKRRGVFGLFSRTAPAARTSRGQKAVRAAIEGLESRVLMTTVVNLTYDVNTTGGASGVVPSQTAGTVQVDTLTDAVLGADQLSQANNSIFNVTITFAIPSSGAATILQTAPLILNNPDGVVNTWTITAPTTGTTTKHPITIDGSGVGANSLFAISNSLDTGPGAGLATISNLLINNVNAGATNGGAVNSTIPLALTSDTFNNDKVTGNGGAINASGSSLTTTNVVFGGDSAGSTGNGGAVYTTANANVFTGAVTTALFGTTTAGGDTALNGGAIYAGLAASAPSGAITGNTNGATIVLTTPTTAALTNGDSVTVSGVTGNTNANTTAFVKVLTATTFELYTTSLLTTPVVGSAGTNSVNGTWSSNAAAATKTTVAGVTFTGNTAASTGSGGAIYSAGTQLNLGSATLRDTFTSNTALTGNGGAIYSADKGLAILDTNFGTTVTTTGLGKDSAINGGAVYAVGGVGATFTATSSTFTGDTASADGGAIYNTDATMTITTSDIGTIGNPNTALLGGGVYTNNSTSLFATDTVAGNLAGSLTTNGNGGAIYADTGSVSTTTTLGSFASNKATAAPSGTTFGNGGAIYSAGSATSTLSVGTSATTKTIFSLNTANNSNATNGGIGGDGGAIFSDDGTLNVWSTLSTLATTANTAAGNGGAIYFGGTNLNVSSSTISFNKATVGSGGGIYAGGLALGTLTVTGSTISSDTASHSGGGIFSNGTATSSLVLMNDTMSSDVATNYNGGAVATSDANFTVEGGTFAADKAIGHAVAPGGAGGALYTTGTTVLIEAGTAAPVFNTIDSAWAYGGAIYFGSTANVSTFTLTAGAFTANTAVGTAVAGSALGSGGAIFNQGTPAGGTSCIFSVSGASFGTNTATASGGAIYSNGGTGSSATFTNDAFLAGNSAKFGDGGAIDSEDASLTVDASSFTSDTALGTTANPESGLGGAIFSAATTLTFGAGGLDTFSTNSATFAGGGLYFDGVNGTINQSNFNADKATSTTVGHLGFGGGIYAASSAALSSLTVNTSTFTLDTSTYEGGAINCDDTNLTITGSSFGGTSAANTSVYGGGAVFFGNNGQISGGGGLGTVNVSTSTFTLNTVSNTIGAGGAIYVESGAGFDGWRDTFTSNSALEGGGAIALNGTANTVSTSTFTTNHATTLDGGGILAFSAVNTLNVFDSTFSANTAKRLGGGIAFNGTQATLANDTFSANTVTTGVAAGGVNYGGGGLYISSSGSTALTQSVVADCTFASNVSILSKSGGGIDSAGLFALLLEGNIVSNNAGTAAGTTATTANIRDDLAGVFDAASSFNIIGDASGTNQKQTGLTATLVNGNHLGTGTAGGALSLATVWGGASPTIVPLLSTVGSSPTQTLAISSGSIAIGGGLSGVTTEAFPPIAGLVDGSLVVNVIAVDQTLADARPGGVSGLYDIGALQVSA